MTDELPDWVREGAKVAEYQPNWNGIDHVTPARIDRLTATQIILDSGARYSRARLTPVGGDARTELRPADDRNVRGAVAAQALASLRHRVDGLWRAGDTRTVEEAEARLAAVEALVRAARQAIAEED